MRKRVAAVLGMVLLLGGCDWTMFRGGAAHTGWNPTEHTLSVSNVGSLEQLWIGPTGNTVSSSPTIAGGIVYVASDKVYAFDAAGGTGCSGTPKICTPLWAVPIPGGVSSPVAIYRGVAYVNGGVFLYAFDAHTGAQLWTVLGQFTAPVVWNGVVYVGTGTQTIGTATLRAFDAAGVTGCSGSPKQCQPLWTAPTNAPLEQPAVANGVVYVGSAAGTLYAFDAAGANGCSATPKVCSPLWTAETQSFFLPASAPAVANGFVYVVTAAGRLHAFDAAGVRNCSGSPTVCGDVWNADVGGSSGLAVTAGVVFAGSGPVGVYDARGVTGCTPQGLCTPLRTLSVQFPDVSPAVGNGVVYIVGRDGKFTAFDASGATCPGTPKVCPALLTVATPYGLSASPAIVNGIVYLGVGNDLAAYGLPSA
jgi:outer membrane protein assembly factor BamB